MNFFLKRLWCCSNSITSFQCVICKWPFLLMVLPDSGISDILLDDATFWGAALCFFRYFWWSISCLGSNDLWTFHHIWVIICLRVNNSLINMSADPKTSSTKYYVLFSNPSGFFQIICRVSILEWYCIYICG